MLCVSLSIDYMGRTVFILLAGLVKVRSSAVKDKGELIK